MKKKIAYWLSKIIYSTNKICQVLLVSLLFVQSLYSQEYKFEHLTIENGLPENGIFSLHIDHIGFLWIGTCNGLVKYDGITFETIQSDPSAQVDLAAACIYGISENKDGNLWLATYFGLYFFDTWKNKIQHFPHLKKKAIGINNAIWLAHEDMTGKVWLINNENELLQLNPVDGKIINFHTDSDRDLFLNKNQVTGLKVALWNRPAFLETSGGDIYVGTEKGVAKYEPNSQLFSMLQYPEKSVKNEGSRKVLNFYETNNNQIWIGTVSGLFSLDKKRERLIPFDEDVLSIKTDTAWVNLEDKAGNIWIAGKGKSHKYNLSENVIETFNFHDPSKFIIPIHEGSDGSFWTFAWQIKNNKAVLHKLNRKESIYTEYKTEKENKNSVYSGIGFSQYIEDKNGVFWIGSFRDGINKLDPSGTKFHPYNSKKTSLLNFHSTQGLSDLKIYKDENGTIWRMLNGELIWVRDYVTDNNNNIWIINNHKAFDTNGLGISKLDFSNNTYTTFFDEYDNNNSDCGNTASAILLDRNGDIWISFWDYFTKAPAGLVKCEPETEIFTCYQPDPNNANSLEHEAIADIHEDKNGNIWIALIGVKGEVSLQKLNPYTDEFTSYENLKVTVWEIEEDKDGMLWLGTILQGLVKFDPKTGMIIKQYRQLDGLANSSVQDIEIDGKGNLWLRTENGLSKFNPSTESFENFTTEDGLITNRANGVRFSYKAKNGDILIASPTKTSKSELIYFTPEKVKDNPYPPRIAFTDFKISNKKIEIGENSPLKNHISKTKELNLSYRQNEITFEFAALHFNRPHKNEYAYRLDPIHQEWRNLGTQNSITLSGLDHGEYTLRVKASNYDGTWNEEGISMNIIISPPWWKTWWAISSFLLLGILSIYTYIQWRTRNLKKSQKILEKQVAIRTEEVVKQKKRSDELLLNILPAEIAQELKQMGSSEAKNYDMVSVLFTDFKGFSKIAKNLSPKELVAEIDYCYKAFDSILEEFNIEKIKTIGDSYMAAGGVPTPNSTNAIDAVLTAFKIRDFMLEYKKQREAEGKVAFEIRIGVHTGPVVAGIVGIKKFAYDIWGDTVNIASRLESNSEAGKINISKSTYELCKNNPTFKFIQRGEINVKNLGLIEMYFVNRI